MSNTVIVHVYNSPDKTDLITVIPIIDAGMVTDDGVEPQSDENLIYIAKFQLKGQKRATEAEIENFHYEVERKS